MSTDIVLVNYSNDQQARDPMGGGSSLPQFVRDNLASELAKIPHAFSVICYLDKIPVGLVNCFQGFSTFKCMPLINIHDVVVLEEHRGEGVCQLMLDRVALEARERGCCKITLEVLEGNKAAQSAYFKDGFVAFELDPELGKALFWEKEIVVAD